KSYGITEIILNVHHYPDQIIQFIEKHNSFNIKIIFSDESDALLETGGGLKQASKYLKGELPFLVMNVDILTNLNVTELINFHKRNKALATLAVAQRETSRYFLFNKFDHLCGWKNLKTGEERITVDQENLTMKAFSG